MNRRLFGLFVGVFACTAVACSSGSGGGGGGLQQGPQGSGGPPGVANYCQTLCNRISECDPSQDVPLCVAGCENANATSGPKLRPEYMAGLTSCIAEKDCKSVLTDSASTDCSNEVAGLLAPSATAQSFCTSATSTWNKCGVSFETAACYSLTKLLSDPTIQFANTCLSKACSEIDGCLEVAFGISSSSAGDDSCQYAFDGVCDEGSYCEYGTDSFDCS